MPDAPMLAELLRRPGYLRLLVLCGVVGIPVSVAAFGFLALEHELQHMLWEDLPAAAGFDEIPWWWGIPSLVAGGLLVALAATRLPGGGGHVPAETVGAAPTEPRNLPGILLAGLASLCLGAVIGPEGILLALGSGVALALVAPRWRSGHPQDAALIGTSGAFAAIATIFGSPLAAALFMIEAIGFGGAQLFAVMLPGLLASGVGALMFTGLGHWTGLEVQSLGLPSLPDLARPDVGDVAWALPLVVLGALLAYAIRLGARRALPVVRARPMLLAPAAGAIVGALGGAYALITGHSPEEALFSGQQTIVALVGDPERWSDGDLVALLVCMGLGYAISLAAFRGGPVFPAVLLGVALGLLLGGLPGLGQTPAVAMAMTALTVSMLRLPVASVLLVVLLIGQPAAVPLMIVAAVAAFVVTEIVDPP